MNVKRTWGIWVCAILMLGLSGCSDSDSYTLGVWQRRSYFDGAARSYASSFTIGSIGYICCGFNGGTKYYDDLWAYHMVENASGYWEQCASLSDQDGFVSRHSAVGFSLNGKGYICCGYNRTSDTYMNDTWEYDPDTDTWTRMDDFPSTGRYGAIGFAVNGYAYVGMGRDEDNYLKDLYRFDPTAPSGSQWTTVTGYGGSKRVYASTFVIDNEAYICLGQDNGTYCDDFWKFDGTTWTELRKTSDDDDDLDYDDDYDNICRWQAVSFVIDGKGYIVTGTNGSYLSDYWVYYPETDLWYGDADDEYTPITVETSTRQAAVSFSTGTRGFFLTGQSGSTSVFDDLWELLPYEYEEY